MIFKRAPLAGLKAFEASKVSFLIHQLGAQIPRGKLLESQAG
jgi:hypothetical protein